MEIIYGNFFSGYKRAHIGEQKLTVKAETKPLKRNFNYKPRPLFILPGIRKPRNSKLKNRCQPEL